MITKKLPLFLFLFIAFTSLNLIGYAQESKILDIATIPESALGDDDSLTIATLYEYLTGKTICGVVPDCCSSGSCSNENIGTLLLATSYVELIKQKRDEIELRDYIKKQIDDGIPVLVRSRDSLRTKGDLKLVYGYSSVGREIFYMFDSVNGSRLISAAELDRYKFFFLDLNSKFAKSIIKRDLIASKIILLDSPSVSRYTAPDNWYYLFEQGVSKTSNSGSLHLRGSYNTFDGIGSPLCITSGGELGFVLYRSTTLDPRMTDNRGRPREEGTCVTNRGLEIAFKTLLFNSNASFWSRYRPLQKTPTRIVKANTKFWFDETSITIKEFSEGPAYLCRISEAKGFKVGIFRRDVCFIDGKPLLFGNNVQILYSSPKPDIISILEEELRIYIKALVEDHNKRIGSLELYRGITSDNRGVEGYDFREFSREMKKTRRYLIKLFESNSEYAGFKAYVSSYFPDVDKIEPSAILTTDTETAQLDIQSSPIVNKFVTRNVLVKKILDERPILDFYVAEKFTREVDGFLQKIIDSDRALDINFTSEPAGAAVSIEAAVTQRYLTTDSSINLFRGKWTISAKKDGYRPTEPLTVDMVQNAITQVICTFKKTENSYCKAVK